MLNQLATILQKLQQSFQMRVFSAFFLIIIIFIPGTGYIGYLQALDGAREQMEQYTQSTGREIAKRITAFLSKHSQNVTTLASLFQNGLIDPTNQDEILQYLKIFKGDHPEFVNIYHGNESGQFVMVPAQPPEVRDGFDPRTRPWYHGAARAKATYWTEVYLFASTQRPGITASAPYYDTEGKLLGVCGIDIDIVTFSDFIQSIDIGDVSLAYVFENKTAHLIAHPWGAIQPEESERAELLKSIQNLKMGEQVDSSGIDYENEKLFTVYTPYPENDWTIGVTISTASYLEKIQFIKKTTIQLVFAAILLSCLLSYLLSKSIISPLLELKQGIEQVTSGDLEHRVEIKAPEIARDLAEAFNQMALSLRTSLMEVKTTYHELQEKQKLAAVGKMTAGIAHEIKNPLGIILGSTQVVLDQKRPWEMREKAASFIMDEVIRLDKTLKAFLAFAKPATPVFAEVDMVQLLEETLSATEERYLEDGYTFTKNFPEAVPLVEADPNQIKQVFFNIFLNAFKAMPEGGSITITVTAETDPQIDGSRKRFISLRNPFAVARQWLIISIKDNGCGMDEEKLEKLMDPFVSFEDDGIGLGLSIVSQLVKMHRGHIQVESVVGEGTIFHLYFPCIIKEQSASD